MSHVFISYRREDGEFVARVKAKLAEQDIRVWIDVERLQAGDDWRQEIDSAIRAAFALVVVMTPSAKVSEYVAYEWAFALGCNVKVLPLMLKQTQLHPRLDALQYLDFTQEYAGEYPWGALVGRLRTLQKRELTTTSSQKILVEDDADTSILDTHVTRQPDKDYPKDLIAELQQTHDISTKVALLKALKVSGSTETIPSLLQIARDQNEEDEARVTAVEVLTNLGGTAIVPYLLLILQTDNRRNVRAAAARALGYLKSENAIDELTEIIAIEPSNRVFKASVEALADIATPGAIEALEHGSRVASPESRRELIREALLRISPPE